MIPGLQIEAKPIGLAEGSDQTFYISPYTDYEVEDVQVDGTSVGTVSSYTFLM